MSNPEISLIIPLYNAAQTVAPLIESIRNQTFDYFEAIFVDDGSTDNGAALVVDAAIRDGRIRLVTQENAGPGAARNKGLDAATGRYVMFADCDDELLPDAMKLAFGCAEDTQADVVVFQAQHKDARTGAVVSSPDRWDASLFPEVFAGTECPDQLFSQFRNWPWDKLFRRSYLDRFAIRYPALYRTEDLPFVCEALAQARRIAPLDVELYRYRVNAADSSTQTRDSHPLDFLESLRLWHAWLVEHELMDTFRADYTRWAGLCVYVNLVELRTYRGFRSVFDALKDGALAELELLGCGEGAFAEPIHEQVVEAIAVQPFEEFLFDLWRLDADIARDNQAAARELDDVMGSASFKVGRVVAGGARQIGKIIGRG